MTDLLVSIILAVCPVSTDGEINDCMEEINNCAVELNTLITEKSIQKCIDEYTEKQRNGRNSKKDSSS